MTFVLGFLPFSSRTSWTLRQGEMSCADAHMPSTGPISNIFPISNFCPIGNIYPIGNICPIGNVFPIGNICPIGNVFPIGNI
jgi:hypothetical protein